MLNKKHSDSNVEASKLVSGFIRPEACSQLLVR